MERDTDLYRRTEFGWFLGALTFATALSAALPVDWWLKLVVGLILAFVLLPILEWVSGPLGRTLRFLLDPVTPAPGGQLLPANGGTATVTMSAMDARAVAANDGVDPNDPLASRVLVRKERGGELYPVVIWPAGTDPVPKMHAVRLALDLAGVYELVAMRGYERVGRWRASRRLRMTQAWRRAADPR